MAGQQTEMFDPVAERGWQVTPEGMAFWAETGPVGRTCRECVSYTAEGRYASGSPRHAQGELKPGRCQRYKEMMSGKWGAAFRHSTLSCKYFEAAPEPPPAVKY
jgi:hypothetical protein